MTTASCRWCAEESLDVVLDLGRQPPADLFPRPSDPRPDPVSPLRMGRCRRCGLAQLVEDPGTVEAALGAEPAALVEQAEAAVATVAPLLRGARTFAEFDSPHGGGWRALVAAHGLQDRSDVDGPVDLVVDVFGLMHERDQRAALEARVGRLAAGGTLLLQYHSVATIVGQQQWNALRHGHWAYYSLAALTTMLTEVGLVPTGLRRFSLYGGTFLLAAARPPAPTLDGSAFDAPAADLLAATYAAESDAVGRAGLTTLAAAADRSVAALVTWLQGRRDAGATVLGYGAASRALPLLTHAGVTDRLLPAVADGAAAKQGRTLAGSRIPVISPAELRSRAPDDVLLLVPDLAPEVRAANASLRCRWWVTEPVLTRL